MNGQGRKWSVPLEKEKGEGKRSLVRTGGHVYAAEGKVDDGGVLLLNKVVLREALRVEDEIRRKAVKFVSLELIAELLRRVEWEAER